MESPARNEGIPTPVDQGSPFFKYLCGLSPIKPARSVHVVQTYAELSLPPPPAVFTSPPKSNAGGGRSRSGFVVSRTASTHVAVETVGLIGSAAPVDSVFPSCNVSSEYSHQSLSRRKVLENEEASGASGSASPKFVYGDVTDYLADSLEEGLYGGSSSSYVPGASTDSQDLGYPNRESRSAAIEDCLSIDSAEPCADGLIQRNCNAKVSNRSANVSMRKESVDELSRDNDSTNEHESSGNIAVEESSLFCEETVGMGFNLVGDDDDNGRNDWVASRSAVSMPEFSKPRTPDSPAIKPASRGPVLRAREDGLLTASNSPVEERASCLDTMGLEENRKDDLVGATMGQRGVRRRCLDFETSVRRKSAGGGISIKASSAMTTSPSIPTSILCERAAARSDATNSAMITSTAVDSHSYISFRSDCSPGRKVHSPPDVLRVSQCSFQSSTGFLTTVESNDPTKLGRDSGNPPSSIGIPSGIGLHLNSLSGSITLSPSKRVFKRTIGIASAKGAVASLLGMPGLTGSPSGSQPDGFETGVVAGSKNFYVGTTRPNFSAGVVISLMERSRMTLRETLPGTHIGGVPEKVQSMSVGSRQQLDGNSSSRARELLKKCVSVGKRRFANQEMSQQSGDEYDGSRSPKRRKSPPSFGDKSEEGCKRCNCKKSKCLKLYCECFAAGTYCVGSCTCYDCFNKPEHEEIVMSTRQQIEARNPLAFAPKIIHSGEASPNRGEEITSETPASGRHKRGCKCKKSLCLKKYCECYQAGVGCSAGCRCEGCKNVFGWKESAEEFDNNEDALEAQERGCAEAQVGNVDLPRHNGKDLTPITPSLQYTGEWRTTSRAVRSDGKKCSVSPLSQSQPQAGPQMTPANGIWRSVNLISKSSSQQSSDMQLSLSGRSLMTTPKLSRVSHSPRWDGLGDICTLTPLPHPPLRPTPASMSTLQRSRASPSFSRQNIEPISSYQPGNRDPGLQPGMDNSLLLSSACFGNGMTKAIDHNQSRRISSDLFDDDDSPDALRYGNNVLSPVITTSNSPKQKRVSPPQVHGMRERTRGDSMMARSSPGQGSGRKFILRALPSLPAHLPSSISTRAGWEQPGPSMKGPL